MTLIELSIIVLFPSMILTYLFNYLDEKNDWDVFSEQFFGGPGPMIRKRISLYRKLTLLFAWLSIAAAIVLVGLIVRTYYA